MAISVKVPKEITEYKEKILFGLSWRQLLSVGVGVGVSVGLGFALTKGLGWSIDSAGNIIILADIPILAFGFISFHGFSFEKLFKLMLRHRMGYKKLTYKTNVITLDDEVKTKQQQRSEKYAWITQGNATGQRIESNCEYIETEDGRAEKRQKIRAAIKAAQQEKKQQ